MGELSVDLNSFVFYLFRLVRLIRLGSQNLSSDIQLSSGADARGSFLVQRQVGRRVS